MKNVNLSKKTKKELERYYVLAELYWNNTKLLIFQNCEYIVKNYIEKEKISDIFFNEKQINNKLIFDFIVILNFTIFVNVLDEIQKLQNKKVKKPLMINMIEKTKKKLLLTLKKNN